MNGISAAPIVVPPASSNSQPTSDNSINPHVPQLRGASAATMRVPPPSIARSNPKEDITSFCAYLWETHTEMCRDVSDDEIPRPQLGNLTTTKEEDDAYVGRFFDRDMITIHGYRFLKMALIAISRYNHMQIVNCADEYFDKDKGNQELFQDPGTAQQMRTTTDITSFFDKKFINDHNFPRFLTRVMQYIQYNFDQFKQTYALSPTFRKVADEVTTTPTGSPGSSDSTKQMLSASDGRLSPISEVEVSFPATLNVPRSRNSQTPIRGAQANGHNLAAEREQDDSTPIRDKSEIRHGGLQNTMQQDLQTAGEHTNSRRANSSTDPSHPESTTPTRRQQHTPSRELSAQRIKEFVPNQPRGPVQGQMYSQGHSGPDPRFGHITHPLPTIADVVPGQPSEYFGYSTNQLPRNDQPRQSNRGRGAYGQGRGRGQGSGSFVVDPNSYQRMPADAVNFPQYRGRTQSTASERSANWREKENENQVIDGHASPDQAFPQPYGPRFIPPHQQMPFPAPGSGDMGAVFANRTNSPAVMPRHASSQRAGPNQGNRPVSNGSHSEGILDVAILNIPQSATGDRVVEKMKEFVNGKFKIQFSGPGFLVLRLNAGAVHFLLQQQPKVIIDGQRLQFDVPPPRSRESRQYSNWNQRPRDFTNPFPERMPLMVSDESLPGSTRLMSGPPFNPGPDHRSFGSFRGGPPVPTVYHPSMVFAGAEHSFGPEGPFAGQYPARPDRYRGPPQQNSSNQNAGASGKKNKKSPKKHNKASASFSDTAWPGGAEGVSHDDPFSSPPGRIKKDTAKPRVRGENVETAAGAVEGRRNPSSSSSTSATSSIETVKQKVSPRKLSTDSTLDGSTAALVRSTASLPVPPTSERVAAHRTMIPDKTITEEFFAELQASAAVENIRRDTVHEIVVESKPPSDSPTEGLAVVVTPKRNLTPREPGDDVDESFQTAHESPIEEKDDVAASVTTDKQAVDDESPKTSDSKDNTPRSEQGEGTETAALRGEAQNRDDEATRSQRPRTVSSRKTSISDRRQELASSKPAKTESLSPFARQPKSKKKDKKPKPTKGKGKEDSPDDNKRSSSQHMPEPKQDRVGSTKIALETASKVTPDTIAPADEAIKVHDHPDQEQKEQDNIPSSDINDSDTHRSAAILLETLGISQSASEKSDTFVATHPSPDTNDLMPYYEGKGKGRMNPVSTAMTTHLPPSPVADSAHGTRKSSDDKAVTDDMSRSEERGKDKIHSDPDNTSTVQESSLLESNPTQPVVKLEGSQVFGEGHHTQPPFHEHQRSISQLSNVTESTQSAPGDKPKSKKKKKPKKKKKKVPTDATTPPVEGPAGPSTEGQAKASTDGGDSDDTEIIFTPPGSSTDSPERSKQVKKLNVGSSSLLQAPPNQLQRRKQKQRPKSRNVSEPVTDEETDASNVVKEVSKAPDAIRSHLRNLGANVKYIDLSGTKVPKPAPAPETPRPKSPTQQEPSVQESLKKMREMMHKETLATLSRDSDAEGIRREKERYKAECFEQKHEDLMRLLNDQGFTEMYAEQQNGPDDEQANEDGSETAASSVTVEAAKNNNDRDPGLTVARANFENSGGEVERVQGEQQRKDMAEFYAKKQKSVGTQLDRDIYRTVNNPELMDAHSEGYRGPVPIPAHPLVVPTLQDRMNKLEEVYGDKSRKGHDRR